MKRKTKIELISDKKLPLSLKKITDEMDKLFKKMVSVARKQKT